VLPPAPWHTPRSRHDQRRFPPDLKVISLRTPGVLRGLPCPHGCASDRNTEPQRGPSAGVPDMDYLTLSIAALTVVCIYFS
jgi:hypothetical protein